jgi:hypothetical protein
MNAEQKKAWDSLAQELLDIETVIQQTIADHDAGKLGTDEFLERMCDLAARRGTVKEKMDAVKATGVKWYHVLWGFVTSGLGLGLAKTGLSLFKSNKIVRTLYDAIEAGGDKSTKTAVDVIAKRRMVAAKVRADVAERFPLHSSTSGAPVG